VAFTRHGKDVTKLFRERDTQRVEQKQDQDGGEAVVHLRCFTVLRASCLALSEGAIRWLALARSVH
jgi:hypothetical protein